MIEQAFCFGSLVSPCIRMATQLRYHAGDSHPPSKLSMWQILAGELSMLLGLGLVSSVQRKDYYFDLIESICLFILSA